MAWKPVDELDEAKRKVVLRRILAGEVASYVDEQGRRRVFVSGEPHPGWALDLVARVRQEVADMRRSAQASGHYLRRRRAA